MPLLERGDADRRARLPTGCVLLVVPCERVDVPFSLVGTGAGGAPLLGGCDADRRVDPFLGAESAEVCWGCGVQCVLRSGARLAFGAGLPRSSKERGLGPRYRGTAVLRSEIFEGPRSLKKFPEGNFFFLRKPPCLAFPWAPEERDPSDADSEHRRRHEVYRTLCSFCVALRPQKSHNEMQKTQVTCK